MYLGIFVKESAAMRPSTEIDTLRQQLPYHRLRQTRKGKVAAHRLAHRMGAL